MKNNRRHYFLCLVLLLISRVIVADVYNDVVSNNARSDADKKSDDYRKPAETLRFFGIKENDVVLDFFAGAGYYSELMAALVGSKGRVDVYNNRPYLDWVGTQLNTRYSSNRMSNTRRLEVEVDELDLGDKQYDVIVAVMALHDVYYADPANGWPMIDKDALYKKFNKALKPGGHLVIVDHAADPSSALRDVQTRHRIDKEFLIKDISALGFKLVAQSDLLRNEKDDHQLSSFDEKIRYHTDRFILKLVKVEDKQRSSRAY